MSVEGEAMGAAVGALTDYLHAAEQGHDRHLGEYLERLVDADGVGVLAQGYFGLLQLSAHLLPGAAAQAGVSPQELLTRIGLRSALEP